MKAEFWLEKWQQDQIGFHQPKYNDFLIKHGENFFRSGEVVLVPLCGATVDMMWFLEHGLKVIGVELSEKAAEMFFTENSLDYQIKKTDDFKVYSSGNIDLYVGDLFEFQEWGTVDCIYDRASIVALPTDLRRRYANVMNQNLSSSRIFLISFEFDNQEVGPPFSVPQEKIEDYFSEKFSITLKDSRSTTSPEMHGGILSYWKDLLFMMTPKKE